MTMTSIRAPGVHLMSRHLKLIAAVAVVLVAISGFSPARSGGGGHRSGSGGGGGCSKSDSSSHNSGSGYDGSDSSYDSDDSDSYDSGYDDGYRRGSRYNNSTGSNGSSKGSSGSDSSPTGTLTECAAENAGDPEAVVSVRNADGDRETYRVRVEFQDATGKFVDSGAARVTVSANGTNSVDVPMDHPDRIDDVAECVVVSVS